MRGIIKRRYMQDRRGPMGWNIDWIFLGGIAYLLAIINLVRSLMGCGKGWQTLMFLSLSFGTLTVLEEYRMVNEWLAWGELGSVINVVPNVSGVLTPAVYIGILLNLIILVINTKKRS